MRLIIGVSACFCLAFGFVERSSTKLRISQCLHNLQLKRDSSVCDSTHVIPVQSSSEGKQQLFSSLLSGAAILAGVAFPRLAAIAEETAVVSGAPTVAEIPKVAEIATKEVFDMGSFKLPYNHENLLFKDFLGKKATIVFNMKIDDPQTVTQFPNLLEIYKKYANEGLNVHAFPTEQGWFEPDDDETVRAKSKEYYGFGNYPTSVVFDKVDLLGPSAHPLYSALTKSLITPNGYGRITLNYEKFLLDSNGKRITTVTYRSVFWNHTMF